MKNENKVETFNSIIFGPACFQSELWKIEIWVLISLCLLVTQVLKHSELELPSCGVHRGPSEALLGDLQRPSIMCEVSESLGLHRDSRVPGRVERRMQVWYRISTLQLCGLGKLIQFH